MEADNQFSTKNLELLLPSKIAYIPPDGFPKKHQRFFDQGAHPYEKGRVKLQRLGNAWQKFPQCLWPWPALEVLCQRSQTEFEQSWAETAEQGCPGQTSCLALLAFCDGWRSLVKIRMIRKKNNNKKRVMRHFIFRNISLLSTYHQIQKVA